VACELDPTLAQAYEVPGVELTDAALAYVRARGADPKCSFGDFAALSDPVDTATANFLKGVVSDGIVAPDFEPVRLTSFMEDDGVDLQDLQMSGDGEVVTFIRGHTPNRQGWVANPASDPRGAERAVWAMSTRGGNPWRITEARSYTLSPDGRWIGYAVDGQIHRAPVNSGLGTGAEAGTPFFTAYGRNAGPVWSPVGDRIAYVSDREDHSFIGVYDARSPAITYLAPSVDHDTSPAWSPDGRSIVFGVWHALQPDIWILDLDGRSAGGASCGVFSGSTTVPPPTA